MTFDKFSDLQNWQVKTWDDPEFVSRQYPTVFLRKFSAYEVHVYFAGSDGCWKWYTENPDDPCSPAYDREGMHLVECLRDCYDVLGEKGIV